MCCISCHRIQDGFIKSEKSLSRDPDFTMLHFNLSNISSAKNFEVRRERENIRKEHVIRITLWMINKVTTVSGYFNSTNFQQYLVTGILCYEKVFDECSVNKVGQDNSGIYCQAEHSSWLVTFYLTRERVFFFFFFL